MLVKKVLSALPIPSIPDEFVHEKKEGFLPLAQLHEDVLAVTVYRIPQKTVECRYFCDGVNSIKLFAGEWSNIHLNTILRGTSYWYYADGLSTEYHHEESEQLARQYFEALGIGYRSLDAAGLCDMFDAKADYRKREQTAENDRLRQQQHFDSFPLLPAGVDAFADSKMPQYLFYSQLDKRSKRKVICSACGKTFTVAKEVPKHKAAFTCPKCGMAARWQKGWLEVTKNTHVNVWTLTRKGEDLYYRVTQVIRTFNGEKHEKRYTHIDDRRMVETVRNGKRKVYNYGLVSAPYCYGRYWKRFPFNKEYVYDAWIFTDNLTQVLGEKFHNVNTAVFNSIRHEGDLFYLLQALREKPNGEYFAKAGMWRLLQMQRTINYDIQVPSHLRRLARKYDVYFTELNQLEKIGVISDERFEAVRRIRDGVFGSSDMMNELGIDKYIRLFGRWNAMYPDHKFTQIEQWYKDYVAMCNELHVDMSNKSVRYPRELKEAHDRLAKRVTMVRNKEENEDFAARCAELYRDMHGYSDKKYTVVFPQLRTDLIAEGESLHHCVGGKGYRDSHLAGVKMIFFIRAAETPEKPLYTLQANVKNGTILQLYGYGDRPAPAEVRAFCKRFLKQLWTGPKMQLTA